MTQKCFVFPVIKSFQISKRQHFEHELVRFLKESYPHWLLLTILVKRINVTQSDSTNNPILPLKGFGLENNLLQIMLFIYLVLFPAFFPLSFDLFLLVKEIEKPWILISLFKRRKNNAEHDVDKCRDSAKGWRKLK